MEDLGIDMDKVAEVFADAFCIADKASSIMEESGNNKEKPAFFAAMQLLESAFILKLNSNRMGLQKEGVTLQDFWKQEVEGSAAMVNSYIKMKREK